MICFMDMSWCNRAKTRGGECINDECDRYFTNKDKKQAVEWWGNEHFPICVKDKRSNKCGYKNGSIL